MSGKDSFKTGGGLSGLKDALESGNDPLIGAVFGSYRIDSLIAEGGMGRVYRASRVDGQFEREVAIKIVAPGMAGEYVQRFEQERQILANLTHPSIAQLYDAGVADSGSLYLVMELVDGMPIDKFVQERAPGVKEKTKLVLALAEALAFAHSKLVVHRDLKPSNVFVTRDGDLKLLDFGIAKILEAPDSLTVESRPMSPRYASPEQLLNEPISVASDIYQCGLLFLAMFEPRDDALQETRSSAARRAVTGESVTVESRIAEPLPAELRAIVNQCLRVEPAERYQSANDLAADLRNYLGGFPVTARSPGPMLRGYKFLKRNWLPASLITLFVAVVTTLTVYHIDSIEHERQAVIRANNQAQAEAAVARSISDFLLRMISGSNAFQSPGEPKTVPQAVIHGASLVQTQLADQPTVRARLVNALAGALVSMQEWQSAKSMLEDALPDLLDHPEVDFDQRGQLRANVAYVTYRLSDFGAAREQYRAITSMYERAGRTDDEVYARAWRRLGLLERSAANYDLAAEYMSRAKAAYEAAEVSGLVMAGFIGDFGLVLSELDDKSAAIEKYQESIRMFRSIQGEACTSCAINMFNLAWALRQQGRLQEALAAVTEADRIFEQYLGDQYGASRRGSVLFETAAIYNQMGDYEEADRLHLEATQAYRNAFGERHSSYALSLYNHAQTHRDHGRCDLALPLLREALDVHLGLFGEEGEWVAKDRARIDECEVLLQGSPGN